MLVAFTCIIIIPFTLALFLVYYFFSLDVNFLFSSHYTAELLSTSQRVGMEFLYSLFEAVKSARYINSTDDDVLKSLILKLQYSCC